MLLSHKLFQGMKIGVDNQGKAEAVRQGMVAAMNTYALVGYWDADLATPLNEIPNFITTMEGNPNLVCVLGSRVKLLGRNVQRRFYRHYLGRVFATFASMVLVLTVYDTQCGAKLFRSGDILRLAFADRFISRWIFDVEILARLKHLLLRTSQDLEQALYEMPLQKWVDVQGSNLKAFDFLQAATELLRIARQYTYVFYQASR